MTRARQLQFPFLSQCARRYRALKAPGKEWQLLAVRECPLPEEMALADDPRTVAAYWEEHIATAPGFNPQREQVVVLCLNTKLRVRGHHVVSLGTMDSAPFHCREVFRFAILASAHSIILMHNHPSGETDPSQADLSITRRVRDAGQLLQIPLRDHVIVGAGGRFFSFRQAGLV